MFRDFNGVRGGAGKGPFRTAAPTEATALRKSDAGFLYSYRTRSPSGQSPIRSPSDYADFSDAFAVAKFASIPIVYPP